MLRKINNNNLFYKQNRKILKKILKENTIKFSANISYEAYTDILAQYKEYSDIKNELKPILYEYLVEKLKEKEIEHNRREVKIANKLYSYIQRKKRLYKKAFSAGKQALPAARCFLR